MSRPPPSTSTPGDPRRSVAVVCLAFACLAAAPATLAEDRLAPAPIVFEPNVDWRAQGLAFIDLPLGIRARFESSYLRHDTASDRLASPFVDHFGPGRLADRALESRIALTRPLSDRIEFEIAWQTRNRIAVSDPMEFGRQVVGAMIRITP